MHKSSLPWIGNFFIVLGAISLTHPLYSATFFLIGSAHYAQWAVVERNWPILCINIVIGAINLVTIIGELCG